MTLTMPMTMSPRRPPTQEARARLDSFAETPTDSLTLSPEFLDALRQVAPRVRPRRFPYALVLVAIAGLGAASVRYGLWHRVVGPWTHAPAPAITSAAAVVTAPSVARADAATTIASVNVPSIPTPVSVDDWVPPPKPKTPKTRHAQMPQ
jgi:hypothetical protein